MTSITGRALTASGSIGMNKNQKSRIKRERAALKEYYKVGGDKMLDGRKKGTQALEKMSAGGKTKVSQINAKHSTTGKASVDRMLNAWADLGVAGGLIGIAAKKK